MNPRNQPGPSVDERVQVWTARHPIFVFVVYPAIAIAAISALGWWAFR